MSLSRGHAARIADETVEILNAGRYMNRAGATVHVRHLLDAAKAGTPAAGSLLAPAPRRSRCAGRPGCTPASAADGGTIRPFEERFGSVTGLRA